MAALLQLTFSIAIGFFAWLICDIVGIADPWPIIVGVIVFLACLGISVVFVDSDWLD